MLSKLRKRSIFVVCFLIVLCTTCKKKNKLSSSCYINEFARPLCSFVTVGEKVETILFSPTEVNSVCYHRGFLVLAGNKHITTIGPNIKHSAVQTNIWTLCWWKGLALS